MHQYTPRIIGFRIHAGVVDSVVLCRIFTSLIAAASGALAFPQILIQRTSLSRMRDARSCSSFCGSWYVIRARHSQYTALVNFYRRKFCVSVDFYLSTSIDPVTKHHLTFTSWDLGTADLDRQNATSITHFE